MLPHKKFASESIEVKLNKCDTFQDMMDAVQNTYDLKNVRLGFLDKKLLIAGISKAINKYKPPLK